jgi:hypothetical protein
LNLGSEEGVRGESKNSKPLNGRHDWIRTSDLFRVKASISTTFNNLQAAEDCLETRKYVEDENLAGDFTGEKSSDVVGPLSLADGNPTLESILQTPIILTCGGFLT